MADHEFIPEDELPFASAGEDDMSAGVFDPFFAAQDSALVVKDSDTPGYPDEDFEGFEGEFGAETDEEEFNAEEMEYLEKYVLGSQNEEDEAEKKEQIVSGSGDDEILGEMLVRRIYEENGKCSELDISPFLLRNKPCSVFNIIYKAIKTERVTLKQTLSAADMRFFCDVEDDEIKN